ncbi:Na+/K+ P-type ATPase [Gamsiella multidivaricata]|uniref:Na+/K+ P-type ATPase n=1 Tax=Gamsiella multidivaricata TaxID=101098 RepID=UPI00221F228B|nr:Na+/K+ P-type ATPase [Gamsiella multidivaricata]KAI7817134.1 Na+/K+ P-type ATPase [Gamsiella multidivaricata]
MGKKTIDLEPETPYHSYSVDRVVEQLNTSILEGLSSEEAANRLKSHGPNELEGKGGVKWYKVLLRQVANVLVCVLLIATVLAFATGDFAEGGVILFIIITNAAIGFWQEFNAEQTMEALRNMSSPTAQVIRDETRLTIPNNQAVPGDIMIFEDGDVIGADCRLFEVFNLETDEALLTGESLPVQKNLAVIDKVDEALGDRLNMVFSSTTVVKGRAKGIVIGTGMDTQIGKIATSLMSVDGDEQTPLQKRLNKMAYFVFAAAIMLVIIVFGVHGFKYSEETAIYAISVSIAIIPEGLVAVVTLTMAFGVSRMASVKAIVRRLSSLESLGAVTNICSDKTGTLTQSKMVAVRMWLPGDGFYRITGTGFVPEGEIYRQGEIVNGAFPAKEELSVAGSGSNHYLRLLQASSLCNMAELRRTLHPETHGEWSAIGDPTEIALQVLAHKAGLAKPELVEQGFNLVAEFPFDSSVKRMSVLYQAPPTEESSGDHYIFTKGATERVLPCCTAWCEGDAEHSLVGEKDDHIEFENMVMERMSLLAEKGLRVLTLAYRKLEVIPGADLVRALDRDEIESSMTFLGLVGIYDPPRAESRPAVLQCYEAGIRVHMLTGDHPSTAAAIAKEVAIIPEDVSIKNNPLIMTAAQFDAMSDEEVDRLVELPRVVARCSPNTKVKMIAALHRRNLFATMTGDGVNDSPSLKAANVGIAMGQSGSDVAKQASDIVLTDDNFATIVRAVAEGRRMFANIQKFVQHLMSANVAEIVVLIIGLAFKDNDNMAVFPMSAVEILFLNMITSSPPAMGLGLEPPSESNMREPPRSAKQGLFSFEVVMDTFIYGLAMGALSFASFVIVIFGFNDGNLGSGCNSHYSASCEGVFRARATSYCCMTFLILAHAVNCRALRETGWSIENLKTLKHNTMLWMSIVVGTLLVFPVVYIPGLNHNVFKHSAMTYEWGLVLASLVIFIAFAEIYKKIKIRLMKPLHLEGSEMEMDRMRTYMTQASQTDSAIDNNEKNKENEMTKAR